MCLIVIKLSWFNLNNMPFHLLLRNKLYLIMFFFFSKVMLKTSYAIHEKHCKLSIY